MRRTRQVWSPAERGCLWLVTRYSRGKTSRRRFESFAGQQTRADTLLDDDPLLKAAVAHFGMQWPEGITLNLVLRISWEEPADQNNLTFTPGYLILLGRSCNWPY